MIADFTGRPTHKLPVVREHVQEIQMEFDSILSHALKLNHDDQVRLIQEVTKFLAKRKRETASGSKKVYTVSEAANLLQASNRSVTQWFDSGKLRGYRIPGDRQWRINYSELVKLLKRKELKDRIPKSETKPQKCFTTGQAAKIIGVSSATVIRWIRSNELKAYSVPGTQDRRIEHANLLKFAKAQGRKLKRIA